MAIERRTITNDRAWLEWRKHDVTASDVASLFGLSPYKTLLELWAEKSGINLGSRKDSAVLRRGRILEPAVSIAVKMERPNWHIVPAREYIRDPDTRIGATPDFFVSMPIQNERGSTFNTGMRHGLLQAKTVAPRQFQKEWTEESPPFWVLLQSQTELMLSELEWGIVAALIVDPFKLDIVIYEHNAHAASHARIRATVREFWKSVNSGEQPKADFQRDSALLSALFPREREGTEIDLSVDNRVPELIADYSRQQRIAADAMKKMVSIKGELKAKLGDAEAAFGDGWRVTWRTQHYREQFRPARDVRVLRVSDRSGRTGNLDDGQEAADTLTGDERKARNESGGIEDHRTTGATGTESDHVKF